MSLDLRYATAILSLPTNWWKQNGGCQQTAPFFCLRERCIVLQTLLNTAESIIKAKQSSMSVGYAVVTQMCPLFCGWDKTAAAFRTVPRAPKQRRNSSQCSQRPWSSSKCKRGKRGFGLRGWESGLRHGKTGWEGEKAC